MRYHVPHCRNNGRRGRNKSKKHPWLSLWESWLGAAETERALWRFFCLITSIEILNVDPLRPRSRSATSPIGRGKGVIPYIGWYPHCSGGNLPPTGPQGRNRGTFTLVTAKLETSVIQALSASEVEESTTLDNEPTQDKICHLRRFLDSLRSQWYSILDTNFKK